MLPWLLFILVVAVAFVLLKWQHARGQRVSAEEKTRHAAELSQQQEQLQAQFLVRQQALFNGMIEGVLLLDGEGRVRMINESLRRFFDLNNDIRGQTIMEAFRWHQLAALAGRLRVEKNIWETELEFNRATRRFMLVNASLVEAAPGAERGQLFVFRDVTRLKELENIRKEFVGNVSHELRTPLSLIKGFAETLLDGAMHDPVESVRFLQKIDKHSDRLLFLIEDLLAISRLESGHAAMNSRAVDLQEATQRVLEDMAAPAQARETRLENKIPVATMIWADTERLQQVLFNLVENAIKYGRPGGRVTIEVSAIHPDKLEVCVADDGPGIPTESIPRIFERFYRVDRARSRDTGGTGLGLAIVKHIVQAHGGEAWVKSELQRGTRFYFTIPLREKSGTPAP